VDVRGFRGEASGIVDAREEKRTGREKNAPGEARRSRSGRIRAIGFDHGGRGRAVARSRGRSARERHASVTPMHAVRSDAAALAALGPERRVACFLNRQSRTFLSNSRNLGSVDMGRPVAWEGTGAGAGAGAGAGSGTAAGAARNVSPGTA
jgi:hypothetical protein